MTRQRLIHPWRNSAAVTAGALAGLVLIAGCSSSSTPASTTSAPASATPSTSATVDPAVATAQAFLAKYLTAPTGLPVTDPLPAKPTPGKTIVYLACEVPQCVQLGDGVTAAAKSVGWQSKILTWKSSDPATLVAAMQQALELKPAPAYVVFSGLPPVVWSSKVPAFKAAGIKLIAASLGPATLGDTLIANLLDDADAKLQGKILADWVIADSGGKAKVLQQDFPDFPTIAGVGTGIRDEIAATCPGCSVTKLDVTGAQLASGGVTPAIISALQRDPSIDYLAASDIALAPGLPAALKAAGLDKVKIVGGAADPTTEQTLRDGTGSAFMANDLGYVGWLAVDVALRDAAGATFAPNGGGMPQELLTKDTVGPAGAVTDFPVGYQDSFKKLWLVG